MTQEQQKQLQELMKAMLEDARTGVNPNITTVDVNGRKAMMVGQHDNLKQIQDFIEAEKEKDAVFAERLLVEGKTIEKCLAYVTQKAMQYAILKMGNMQGQGAYLKDDIVFEWVKEYYMLDNLGIDKENTTQKTTTSTTKSKANKETKTPLESMLSIEESETTSKTIEAVEPSVEEVVSTEKTQISSENTSRETEATTEPSLVQKTTTEPKVVPVSGGIQQVSLF